MGWYMLRQNNSGGRFKYDLDTGISVNLYIEGDDVEDANYRAELAGVYFDDGLVTDCKCCGPRWEAIYEWDAVDSLEVPRKGAKLDKKYGHFSDKKKFETFVHPKRNDFYGTQKVMRWYS